MRGKFIFTAIEKMIWYAVGEYSRNCSVRNVSISGSFGTLILGGIYIPIPVMLSRSIDCCLLRIDHV